MEKKIEMNVEMVKKVMNEIFGNEGDVDFVMECCPDICAAIAEHRTNGNPYEMPSLLSVKFR